MHPNWQPLIGAEFDKPYYRQLLAEIAERERNGVTVFPPAPLRLAVFDMDPFLLKTVILGQDPYFKPGEAHGFSFSVPPGVAVPSSLRNIYKEIQTDVPTARIDPKVGNLAKWVGEQVFLLNNVLTVEKGNANSHKKLGWEPFTEAVLTALNQHREGLVFMLWGNNARVKTKLLDKNKHLVLEAAHPSGLSAYRGFLGCRHFSQANTYLTNHGIGPVDWSNV